jgi:UDP-N-acetylglucosamine 4,6-dehydratase/5-epimerase
MNFLKNKTILITGGTGSFGNAAVDFLTSKCKPKKIIIFSRDENKQYEMQKKFKNKNLRFFLGDIRDEDRLLIAFKDVDYVVHAAAQKHVPAAEYNPFECIKTNINGAQSIISACLRTKVKKVVALSTDKACNPINLYGATKLCAEKLFINANQLSGSGGTKFSVVRYGNVIASRGSVIPFFRELVKKKAKFLPLTHNDMTRFFITLPDSVKFVFNNLETMSGGEIVIPKMNSILIKDLIKMISSKIKIKIVGIRPGEKIHEILYSKDESDQVYETTSSFKIYPTYKPNQKKSGKKVNKDFEYISSSKKYLNTQAIFKLIKKSKVLSQ